MASKSRISHAHPPSLGMHW